MLITVSQNKVTGDRSFSNDIWEIVGINAGHLLLRANRQLNTNALQDPNVPRLVPIGDYEFYCAADLSSGISEMSLGARQNH